MALQTETPEQARALSDLRMQIGEPVRVEIKSPRARFTAKLLGYAVNGGLIISAPSTNSNVPMINEGNIAHLRMISGNRICSFNCKILKQYDLPFGYWILEYPAEIDQQRIREHTRVPVRLLGSVDDHDEMSERQDLPVSTLCVDISLGGACLQLPRTLGEVGDKFYLTTRVRIGDIDQVLLAPVELRNVHTSAAEAGTLYNHGVKFFDLDEDTRLIISAFVFQQFLVETGNLDQNGQEF